MIIQPGIAIECNERRGTLGLLAKRPDEPEKLFLLSCWHILDYGDKRSDVLLPDSGNILVAKYERNLSTSSEEYDAAIAEIVDNENFEFNNRDMLTDKEIRPPRWAKKKMELIKSGIGSKVTRCQVQSCHSYYGKIKYGIKLKRHFNGKFLYCKAGDSGAIWRSTETRQGIAMHCQGGYSGNNAAAVPLILVLRHFNIELL